MKPINVLVIEDEADIQDVVAVNLRAEGYKAASSRYRPP
jgi:DNA-binding response OmpR family regulator